VVRDLRATVALTFVTLGLLICAVAVTWYTPPQVPETRVDTVSGSTVCGELSVGQNSLAISYQGSRVVLRPSDIARITAVERCDQ
jgi:hypothetical protein